MISVSKTLDTTAHARSLSAVAAGTALALAVLTVLAASVPAFAQDGTLAYQDESSHERVRAERAAPLPHPLGEGFFRPDQIDLPSGVERGLQSVVRVAPEIRFRLRIFGSRKEVAAARKQQDQRKEFLAGGGVIWNQPVDTSSLGKLCGNPVAQIQPGLREICAVDWRTECEEFPCTVTSRELSGTGTGVVIGEHPDHGILIATPYHIARESIERHDRTDGTKTIDPVPAPDVRVGIDTNGSMQEGGYEYVDDVTLLAHASAEAWQQGEDWALIAIPARYGEHVRPAVLSASRPAPGDTLWAAGFPYRTMRKSASQIGYPNAEDELRVSVGRTPDTDTLEADAIEETDVVNTLDVVNGSSGSPVFSGSGHLVGMVRHGHCNAGGGQVNVSLVRYCGVALITPIDLVSRYVGG